jgi:hypothetical protein
MAAHGPDLAENPVPHLVLRIGDSLGHPEETISGELCALWQFPECSWKPIRGCAGRHTLKNGSAKQASSRPWELRAPDELAAAAVTWAAAREKIEAEAVDKLQTKDTVLSGFREKVRTFRVAGARDAVVVLPLGPERDTGLISYASQPEPGSVQQRFVHTLNTPAGFRRKLESLGIDIDG